MKFCPQTEQRSFISNGLLSIIGSTNNLVCLHRGHFFENILLINVAIHFTALEGYRTA